MHHLTRRLTGISAIALFGVIAGLAQDQQTQPAQGSQAPAAPAPAAQAQPQKKVKDQGEYDLYTGVTKETDANKKLALLKTWKDKYPSSDFKEERLEYFLETYQQLGQSAQMIDTAKEILTIDPKNLKALYWIAFLTPTLNSNSPDALDAAQKAANGLLGAEKPANVKDEDWTKAKAQTDAIGYTTLGWVAMQRKDNDTAEQNFKKSLAVNPNQAQVSYWLGNVILAEKKPERQGEALYHIARAAAYDGAGALTPQGRQQIDAYLTKAYKTLHGDDSGLNDLKNQAKASAMPPDGFKLQTAAEAAAAQEEDLKKTNPSLALWMNIKGQLLGDGGQQYFDSNMKSSLVPNLKGWLIAAKPAGLHAKELQVSMEGKDQTTPDVTLKLVNAEGTAAPAAGKVEVGYEITFDGVPDSFTKDPFMLTFNVEKSKITGLKEEKAAPAHRPVHKK